MVYKAKLSYKIYKEYGLDIWGCWKNTLLLRDHIKPSKVKQSLLKLKIIMLKFRIFCIGRFVKYRILSKFQHRVNNSIFYGNYLAWRKRKDDKKRRYLFRVDIIDPRKPRRRYRKQVLSIRLIQLFYIIHSFKFFRFLTRKARRQRGLFEESYLYLLEGRISCVLYRTSFVSTMKEALLFIKQNVVSIAFDVTKNIYKLLPIMKPCFLAPFVKGAIWWNLAKRLNRGSFLGFPRYIFISKIFLWFIVKFYPRRFNLLNPVNVDILRIANYIR